MEDFRISLGISAALHAAVLIGALIGLAWAPAPNTESAINSIDLNFEISEDGQQILGERDGQRQETPQRRETTNPTQDPVPVPPDPSQRPVDPSSAPTPPPRPERVAETPAPPQETRPTPTPPPAPTQDQSLVEQQDQEALLRKIEEQRKAEEQARDEAKKEEARKREEARKKEEQRKLEEARRKEEERKKAEQRAQIMRDMINNQRGRIPQQGIQGTSTQTASLGNPTGPGRRLTQSQYAMLGELIRSQIAPCWSPPPGTADRGKLIVKIELHMNRDGSLDGRPAVTNQSSDPGFRQVSDSAVRAILICAQRQGGKLNLPVEMYDAVNGWKEIEFAFDPSQMS